MCSCCLEPTFWDGNGKNYRQISHIFYIFFTTCAVCFIVFLKSFVSRQALAEALEQNSTLTYLNLQGNIGHKGAKAWCLVKMVSWGERVWRKEKEGWRHSCLTVRSGEWWKAMQRCFSDVPCLRSNSIGEHLSMTGDKSLARNRNICNINNRLEVPCIIESENAVQRWICIKRFWNWKSEIVMWKKTGFPSETGFRVSQKRNPQERRTWIQ